MDSPDAEQIVRIEFPRGKRDGTETTPSAERELAVFETAQRMTN